MVVSETQAEAIGIDIVIEGFFSAKLPLPGTALQGSHAAEEIQFCCWMLEFCWHTQLLAY